MEFKKGLEGSFIMLSEKVRWKNYAVPTEELKAGTILRLESWRPEGYYATTVSDGEQFFLFKKYIESGSPVLTDGYYTTIGNPYDKTQVSVLVEKDESESEEETTNRVYKEIRNTEAMFRDLHGITLTKEDEERINDKTGGWRGLDIEYSEWVSKNEKGDTKNG